MTTRASAWLRCRAASPRSASRSRSAPGSRGRRPGPARSPSRCGPRQRLLDQLAVRLARARARRPRRPGTPACAESVDTSAVVAGFAGPESVDTPSEMAGFEPRVGGHPLGNGRFWRRRRPRPATAMPAAFRYALAVSRRTPVASSMRRSDQPSRPSASTCCLLLVAQDVGHPGGGSRPPPPRQRLGRYPLWPVFRCPSMAGFGCPPRLSASGRPQLGS